MQPWWNSGVQAASFRSWLVTTTNQERTASCSAFKIWTFHLCKFDDIQELMPTIPAFFHPFYSQLIVKRKKVAAKKMKRLSLRLEKQVKLIVKWRKLSKSLTMVQAKVPRRERLFKVLIITTPAPVKLPRRGTRLKKTNTKNGEARSSNGAS